jgi:hypothetical protein
MGSGSSANIIFQITYKGKYFDEFEIFLKSSKIKMKNDQKTF